MMRFQRYGNTFVAQDGETLYVVSFYLGEWVAYFTAQPDPERVGLYGYSSPRKAQQACENHAAGVTS